MLLSQVGTISNSVFFSKRYRYRFGDIDFAGIAYYPALLHYFHCAFEDWWADGLGTPYARVFAEDRIGLPCVHLDVDFCHPIRFGDEPEIALGVLELGTASVKFGMWMRLDGRSRPACRARITTVTVDMDTMQSRELPAQWRKQFARFMLAADEFPGET